MRGGSFIGGLQWIGVGVEDVDAAFSWCRRAFGTDISVFEDRGVASLMHAYTGGVPQPRRAILALNLQGGGTLELWQFTERAPRAAAFEIQLGDLGIFCARIKARDGARAHAHLAARATAGATGPTPLAYTPAGEKSFFVRDPSGLIWNVVEADGWFTRGSHPTGGVAGCTIGVSDMGRSFALYRDLLGYQRILSDATGVFEDWAGLPGGAGSFRRVLLGYDGERPGAFGRLFGSSRIELVQSLDRAPRRIFEHRWWGDLGYIHLCFDVNGMDEIGDRCTEAGFPFTVDSASSFDMGDSAGRFAYLEDPDGALIELVESRRLAISRRRGWFLDLSRRDPRRPLPRVLLRLLSLNRTRG
jgi:catechol 2,3-dioxygenase-like lactoylglutathione lyase family enzyme/uncharacterized glyoxalase superfamily protein PhnB